MRLDEILKLNDVLKADQYITLLKSIKADAKPDINIVKLKNQIISSWKKGQTSRKHYDDLLGTINVSLGDLIK